MDYSAIPRAALTPVGWFNNWTKKRGAERLHLMRTGSEALTPMIELVKMVGPAGIMWGSNEEVDARFHDWVAKWESCRQDLLTYTNAHPSESVRAQGEEVVKAAGESLSATRYLFLMRNTADGSMDDFHNAERRQQEAIASAERLLKTIRNY